MIEIDWIIGIFVFFVFVSWSFLYYSGLFGSGNTYIGEIGENVANKVIDNISVEVYDIPVRFYSENNTNDVVLKAGYIWYNGEKNSTRIYNSNEKLPCKIVGDNVYWLTNLTQGYNNFTIEFVNMNTTLECNDSFSTSYANLTIPWVAEKKTMISLNKILLMNETSYENFKENLGIGNDFQFVINSQSFNLTYGKSPPKGYVDVVVINRNEKIWENNEYANITMMVW